MNRTNRKARLLALSALVVWSLPGCETRTRYDGFEDEGCFPERMRTLRARILGEEGDALSVRIDANLDPAVGHMNLSEYEIGGLSEVESNSGVSRLDVRGLVPSSSDGLVSVWVEAECFVDDEIRAEFEYIWDSAEGGIEVPIVDLIVTPTRAPLPRSR